MYRAVEGARARVPADSAAGSASFGLTVVLVVAIAELPLCELPALLRLDAEGRDRPCLEATQTDLVAGFLAVAVRAVLDPHQGRVDLLQQLTLAVAGPKLEPELRFLRRAVVRVREIRRLVLHVQHRAVDFLHQLALPGEQDLAEVLPLPFAHVGLAALRLVRLKAAQRPVQDAADALRLRRCRCRLA